MPRRGASERPAGPRRTRAIQASLIAAGLASGLVAVTLGGEWSDPLVWASDLVVGIVFIVVSALLWTTARMAALLALAVGVTWYLGSFLPLAEYWHRGPVIHLILLAPLYRPGHWPRRVILVVAYVVSAVPALWSSDVVAIAVGLALVVIAWIPGTRTSTERRAVLLSRWSLTVLALGILGGTGIATLVPHHDGAHAALLQYEAALVVVAVLQLLARRTTSTAALTDLVVELEESRSDALSIALGRALGDETVRVGYWDSAARGYRDVLGRAVESPSPDSGSASTEIRRDDGHFAMVIHEVSLEDDPRLIAAISAATALTSANAGLQAATRARVAEVEASRTRLVLAADSELRDLARELTSSSPPPSPSHRTDRRPPARRGSEAADTFTASRAQLRDVLDILDAAALGLPPRELDGGLHGALTVLAQRCPLPVTLDADEGRLPPEVESALYLCAAEAVTSSVKHAAARAIGITLKIAEDHVALTVADDGSGAVDVEAGTGITGIADRVAALGGRLAVDATPGAGTVIAAGLPLR